MSFNMLSLLHSLALVLNSGSFLIWIAMAFMLVPVAAALPEEQSFPDIPFQIFSKFILDKFCSEITLSQVLVILFTITDNPDLLSLHARQQHPKYKEENVTSSSGWIKGLARALQENFTDKESMLFNHHEITHETTENQKTGLVGEKLGDLAKVLKMHPYNTSNRFLGKLKAVSYKSIQGAQVICPDAVVCQTKACNPRALLQSTRSRDIPRVTLIKGTSIYENVHVLTGHCPQCDTRYLSDHERALVNNNWTRVYLNSAKYLKIGQNLWVDRIFSGAVVNGMYSFHASAASYTEYWNNSFWKYYSENSPKISRRQVWHTFVQESVRSIAAVSNRNLELQDGLAIDEVTKEAFTLLGENGIIRMANDHACGECTQPYKHTVDTIIDGATAQSLEQNAASSDDDMDIDTGYVKMVVVDGLVMGPQHCAYDNCISDLANARGGVFCAYHEAQHGAKCRVQNCTSQKLPGTQACAQHERQWLKYSQSHTRETYSGARRMLQRSGENMPWQSITRANTQPHDEPSLEVQRTNYFSPSRFYCVETICAPCGVVIAWAKFAKSESPTNILNFLQSVYPTEESKPDYVCIDKACLVLRTAISNGSWDSNWKNTTRFIVDAYHYINHQATDHLCRKWCNPAPQDGSAPNLVVVDRDKNGRLYNKRAFNTQVRSIII